MPPENREALVFWGYDVFPGWHYPTRKRAGKGLLRRYRALAFSFGCVCG